MTDNLPNRLSRLIQNFYTIFQKQSCKIIFPNNIRTNANIYSYYPNYPQIYQPENRNLKKKDCFILSPSLIKKKKKTKKNKYGSKEKRQIEHKYAFLKFKFNYFKL